MCVGGGGRRSCCTGGCLDRGAVLYLQIGACTVSGNIRRSAEIAFGEAECEEFLDLKNYEKNPQRQVWPTTSHDLIVNNTVRLVLSSSFDIQGGGGS